MKRYAQYDLENMSVEEKEELASTIDDVEMLRKLAEDPWPYVRIAVAENPNTPADVLMLLTDDDSMGEYLIYNPNVTDEIIEKLLKYNNTSALYIASKMLQDWDSSKVSKWLDRIKDIFVYCYNNGISDESYFNVDRVFLYELPPDDLVDVYMKLNEDTRGFFADEILTREDAVSLPDWFIRQVFEESLVPDWIETYDILYHIFEGEAIPEIVEKLAKEYYDSDIDEVRYWIAKSKYTPVDILRKMINDKDERVRKEVQKNLKKRNIRMTESKKRYYIFKKFSNQLERMK